MPLNRNALFVFTRRVSAGGAEHLTQACVVYAPSEASASRQVEEELRMHRRLAPESPLSASTPGWTVEEVVLDTPKIALFFASTGATITTADR